MNPKPPKAPAFYLRVSTDSQDYVSQLHAITEFCFRAAWPLPVKANTFSETRSGAKASGTELDRLLKACRAGKFDTIVVYRGDRLGRSLRHMCNLYAELEAIKIRVVGVTDGIDTATDTPGTKFLRNMLASLAEWQRENIVENTMTGLRAARKRGSKFGRPRTKEKQIQAALILAEQGLTRSEIHRRTGLSIGYVSQLLTGKSPAAKPKQK